MMETIFISAPPDTEKRIHLENLLDEAGQDARRWGRIPTGTPIRERALYCLSASAPRLTRIFCHAPDLRPGSYLLFRRFATSPSSPCAFTERIRFSSFASSTGEYRIGSPPSAGRALPAVHGGSRAAHP